jgi:hypothetical protein
VSHSSAPARAWRPTPHQQSLLTAALASGEDCLAAWEAFAAECTLDTLNLGTKRLLPLAYENLRRWDADFEIGPAVRDALAEMWCETHVVFDEATALLEAFGRAGIDTLVLKGVPLAFLDYAEPTLRPLTDVDLLVHRHDARRAMQLLADLGWASTYTSPESFMTWTHAVPFTNDRGGRCDLHWQLLWNRRWGSEIDFWDGSVPFEIHGVKARAMNAADRLLHVCMHATMWNAMSPVRWAADAAMVIRANRDRLDWERFTAQARTRRVTLAMAEMLDYLRTSLAVAIPDDIIDSVLRRTPATRADRFMYYARTGAAGRRYTTMHLHDWWVNASAATDRSIREKCADFWHYIAALYFISEWQVPFYVCYLIARQLRNVAGVLVTSGAQALKR